MTKHAILKEVFNALFSGGKDVLNNTPKGINEVVAKMIGQPVFMKLHCSTIKKNPVSVLTLYYSESLATKPGFNFGFISFACTPDEHTGAENDEIIRIDQNDSDPFSDEAVSAITKIEREIAKLEK
jgi:hypothetical protein